MQILFDELFAADLIGVAVYVEGRCREIFERDGTCRRVDFERNGIFRRVVSRRPIARYFKQVVAREVGDNVFAVAAGVDEHVRARAAGERVVARAAPKRVVAVLSEQLIVARVANQLIVVAAAVEIVVAFAA